MFEKLLVCTDLSEASKSILGCVENLKSVDLREVILAHVIYIAITPGLDEMLREEALPALEELKLDLESRGVKTKIEMPTGVPAYALNDLANKHDVSTIVIGSHGKSVLREAVIGSVSFSLLHLATKPVLLSRLRVVEEEGGAKYQRVCTDLFRKILFPTDFSDTAARAERYLEHIIGETKSPVTILHVQDKNRIQPHLMDHLDEFISIDRERMEMIRGKLVEAGASSVEIEISLGYPTTEILEMAKSKDFSLIVMGSQGRGFISEVFLGSVANNVARLAPLPVLFVPALR